jgi:hypothetical protein
MTQVLSEIFRRHPSTPVDAGSVATRARHANELYDSIFTYDLHLHRDVDLTEADEPFFAAAGEIERDYRLWLERHQSLYDHLGHAGPAGRGDVDAIGFIKRFHRAQHRVATTTEETVELARQAKSGPRMPLQQVMDELSH